MFVRKNLKTLLLWVVFVVVWGRAGNVIAQAPLPPERETIESQTLDAARRGQPSPGYVPTRSEIGLPSRTVAADVTLNVYMLVFNPTYLDGRSLIEYAGWNDPDVLTDLTAAALQNSNNNQYGFHVAQHVVVPDYPLFRGGMRLTNELYEPCRVAFENGTTLPSYCDVSPNASEGSFDPAANLQLAYVPGTVSACEALQSGAADEVWIWAMPGSNAYEWYVRDPSSLCPGATRQFAVMFFNYERGLDCSLESFGHRAESIMMRETQYSVPLQIAADFESFTGVMWRYDPPYNDYICPSVPDETHPEVDPDDTHAGNVHLPPNAYCHYQYTRDLAVWSDAEDWKLNYPYLTGQKTLINRDAWNCFTDGYSEVCHANYLQWWFNHWPNRLTTPGDYINWWEYILFTVDQFPVMLLTMNPFPNDHTAPPDSDVYTSYTWPMVPQSVNNQTFAVFGSQTGRLEGTYTLDGVEITFTPEQPLHAGELVYTSITRDLVTEFGRNISRSWVWQFQVQPEPGPGTFMHNDDVFLGVDFSDLVVADVTGGGLLDILTVNKDNDSVVIFLNSSGGDYNAGIFWPRVAYVECLVHSPISYITVGDVNGDGTLDILATSTPSSTLHVLLGTGSGGFASAVSYDAGFHPLAPALGDVDGDGDLDVLVGNDSVPTKLSVLKNDGNGGFSSRIEYPCYASHDRIRIGDMDKDGDLDAVLFNVAGGMHLIRNDGTGAFSPELVSFGGEVRWLDIGDVDGDGDLDVLAANASNYDALSVLLNRGDGTFNPRVDYSSGDTPWALAVADVEGDGDLDALVIADGLVVFMNDGSGIFTRQAKQTVDILPYQIAMGDVDADGDLDMVGLNTSWDSIAIFNNAVAPELRIVGKTPVPNQNAAPPDGVFRVDFSQPLGFATIASGTLTLHGSQSGRILGTYSKQGAVVNMTLPQPLHPGELVQASATVDLQTPLSLRMPLPDVWQFRARTTPGGGYFGGESREIGEVGDLQSLALGDIDGDGDLDIAAVRTPQSNPASPRGVIYLNDGYGGFVESQPLNVTADVAKVRLGDMNGDGDLDMLMFIEESENIWFINILYNNGDGSFAPDPFGLGGFYESPCPGMELGDLNGDGDMDVLVACSDFLRVHFSERYSISVYGYWNSYFEGNPMSDVAPGDVDGDGDLDMISASSDGQSRIYFNDGRSQFDEYRLLDSIQHRATAVDVGDLDGDGDLDAVIGQNGRPGIVYFNDGDGTFDTITYTLPTSGATTDVALGDLDGDGDLDIVFTFSDQPSVIYLNNSDGTFVGAPGPTLQNSGSAVAGMSDPLQLSGSTAQALALGDVTGDGRLDLVTGGVGQAIMLYINHHRVYLPLLLRGE